MGRAQNKRSAQRKTTERIEISRLTSLDDLVVIARTGYLVDASATGFLIHISRQDLVPRKLRENLNLEPLIGEHIMVHLPQMNLEIEGRITRAHHIGRGVFAVAIDFSDESPEYWRECLIELLPAPGEMD